MCIIFACFPFSRIVSGVCDSMTGSIDNTTPETVTDEATPYGILRRYHTADNITINGTTQFFGIDYDSCDQADGRIDTYEVIVRVLTPSSSFAARPVAEAEIVGPTLVNVTANPYHRDNIQISNV